MNIWTICRRIMVHIYNSVRRSSFFVSFFVFSFTSLPTIRLSVFSISYDYLQISSSRLPFLIHIPCLFLDVFNFLNDPHITSKPSFPAFLSKP